MMNKPTSATSLPAPVQPNDGVGNRLVCLRNVWIVAFGVLRMANEVFLPQPDRRANRGLGIFPLPNAVDLPKGQNSDVSTTCESFKLILRSCLTWVHRATAAARYPSLIAITANIAHQISLRSLAKNLEGQGDDATYGLLT